MRGAGILDEKRLKAEIAGHARRRRHAVIGRQAAQHDRVDVRRAQPRFQIGADEGTVHILRNDDLARERLRFRLEGVAGRARTERALLAARAVLDVEQRPSR